MFEDSGNRKRIILLGSTGSIGRQAIDVVSKHSDKVEIVGLIAGNRIDVLAGQAKDLGVNHVVVGNEKLKDDPIAHELKDAISKTDDGFLAFGNKGILDMIRNVECDIILNALVGSLGFEASILALEMGRSLALANKESLVVAGDLIMPLANGFESSSTSAGSRYFPSGRLLPIDSEHGAIFQCLLGERIDEVEKLIVTASGGPFRGRTLDELKDVDAKAALAHPTWNMGPKITIDSSTLMNKGLEVIEAHHLFGFPYERIDVLVQPQSAIHSMVEFMDGSIKAHLGTTDMRIPIQFALSYPDRWESPVKPMNFPELSHIDFERPDLDTFKCLRIAYEVGREGGTLPCAMNAANEVAVASFLAGDCSFLDIADCIEHVVNSQERFDVESVEQLSEIDSMSRTMAREYLDA